MVEICPTTYSAATGPRASRVRPPRDCATGCALVLKCVWMELHRYFFCAIFGTVFPLPLFFKGVGPWGSKNANGVFYMGVYKVH